MYYISLLLLCLLLLRRDGSSDTNNLQLGRRRWRCRWIRSTNGCARFSTAGRRRCFSTLHGARFRDLLIGDSLATARGLSLLLVHVLKQVLDVVLALFTLLLADLLRGLDLLSRLVRNLGQQCAAQRLSTLLPLCFLLDLILLLLLGV